MDTQAITRLKTIFDEIMRKNEQIEYWTARDLQVVLGYRHWESFWGTIIRAIDACKNSGIPVEDHFRRTTKLTEIGSDTHRNIVDYALTRYACYLIAQNGDSKKAEIAFAQTYFALQTRKQELIEDRLNLLARMEAREKLKESEKQLSKNIYERGVDDKGFGRIRSKGDAALFGGYSTADMKNKLGVTIGSLADRLPTLTIAAKSLANEMTNHNVEENDLQGEPRITKEHVQNNTSVRDMLERRGILPELLPAAEDIKKLERRVKSDEKKIAFTGKLPPSISEK